MTTSLSPCPVIVLIGYMETLSAVWRIKLLSVRRRFFVDQAMTSAGIPGKGLALACLLAGLAYDHMPFTGG